MGIATRIDVSVATLNVLQENADKLFTSGRKSFWLVKNLEELVDGPTLCHVRWQRQVVCFVLSLNPGPLCRTFPWRYCHHPITSRLVSSEQPEFYVTSVMPPKYSKSDSSTKRGQMRETGLNVYNFRRKKRTRRTENSSWKRKRGWKGN
jgi:hypothetical protein